MIEINLLPGKKKAAKGAGMSLSMPDFKALIAQVKDPWLLGAIAAWVLVGGGGALLFVTDKALTPVGSGSPRGSKNPPLPLRFSQ